MCRLYVVVAILSFVPIASAQAQNDKVTQKLVGAWRLAAIEGKSPTIPMELDHPTGLIVYTSSGWMSVQYSSSRDRKPFAKGLTAATIEEKAAAFDSYVAYYGTFKVDSATQTITHRLEDHNHPGRHGVDNVRWFEFQGKNRVVLIPREDGKGGVINRKNATYKLIWERIQ